MHQPPGGVFIDLLNIWMEFFTKFFLFDWNLSNFKEFRYFFSVLKRTDKIEILTKWRNLRERNPALAKSRTPPVSADSLAAAASCSSSPAKTKMKSVEWMKLRVIVVRMNETASLRGRRVWQDNGVTRSCHLTGERKRAVSITQPTRTQMFVHLSVRCHHQRPPFLHSNNPKQLVTSSNAVTVSTRWSLQLNDWLKT